LKRQLSEEEGYSELSENIGRLKCLILMGSLCRWVKTLKGGEVMKFKKLLCRLIGHDDRPTTHEEWMKNRCNWRCERCGARSENCFPFKWEYLEEKNAEIYSN